MKTNLRAALIIIILIVFGCSHAPEHIQVQKAEPVSINDSAAIDRLCSAIKLQTVSYDDTSMINFAPYVEYLAFIKSAFPLISKNLKLEMINGYSLLYTWQGSDASLKPVVLMSHYDVVPADSNTLKDWKQPPFSGNIVEGIIWGRGTLDNKHSMLAVMESVETLLKAGFYPKRTIYLAFGHDEEIGGINGAAKTVAFLKAKGAKPEFVLDEGGCVKTDGVAGVKIPVALIGISEKGSLNLLLEVNDKGGHSSMPPKHTALGKIARAITRLENYSFPESLSMLEKTIKPVAPKMSGINRFVLTNTWLTGPLVKSMMSKSPDMAASIHTTIAATQASGSSKSNVLPTKATAVVNFRLFPGDSVEKVVKKVTEVIDDPEVKITTMTPNFEASPVSSTSSAGFNTIVKTIRQTLEDKEEITIAPYLMLGGSDAKHFGAISPDTYRFLPVFMDKKQLDTIHGTNESIETKNYLRMIQFYAQLIKNVQQ
jgi:carboxypeptidase PM20D1